MAAPSLSHRFPNPEGYAMLPAGLGAIGLTAHRRNKADSA